MTTIMGVQKSEQSQWVNHQFFVIEIIAIQNVDRHQTAPTPAKSSIEKYVK